MQKQSKLFYSSYIIVIQDLISPRCKHSVRYVPNRKLTSRVLLSGDTAGKEYVGGEIKLKVLR